ncbi:hypothetical protein AAFF_G00274090 [Aldrovandia affinis]|uniref:Uncharacterized protein n=1 Tax=Aldrovandia affinis TaxID=143900 RepID=A0AAD7SRK9_9TELE|nr:hypothetical protein AAFF_G00274090 [Aldrovandia affinis]
MLLHDVTDVPVLPPVRGQIQVLSAEEGGPDQKTDSCASLNLRLRQTVAPAASKRDGLATALQLCSPGNTFPQPHKGSCGNFAPRAHMTRTSANCLPSDFAMHR